MNTDPGSCVSKCEYSGISVLIMLGIVARHDQVMGLCDSICKASGIMKSFNLNRRGILHNHVITYHRSML